MKFLTINAFVTQTFREAIRNKILYGIGFFAVAMLLFMLVLGELSLYEQERVMRDLGVSFITLMGVVLAIYTGVGMLQKEIQRKTITTILSKPVRRYEVYIGKFLGIALTLFVELLAMFAVFLALLTLRDMTIDISIFQAFWLAYLLALVVAAASLMFSSFSSPVLSSLLSVGFFVLGSLSAQLGIYAQQNQDQSMRAGMRAAEFLLPRLSHFDMSKQVSYGIDVPWSHIGFSSLHALAYLLILLTIGAVVFENRDFI